MLAIKAIFPEHKLLLRDITQAYTQSTTNLNRDFYTKPPKDVPEWDGFYLKVVKPLYGIPEAGNHWFGTYQKHHLEKLKMTQSTYDPCLMYTHQDDRFGIVGLQTDDTLIVADDVFAIAEEEQLQQAKFLSKPREELSYDKPLKFNGGMISQVDDSIILTQPKYGDTLRLVMEKPIDSTSSRGIVRKQLLTKDQYIA